MYKFHHDAHAYFRNLVLSPTFACVGAQAAVKANNYAFCAYPDMVDPNVAEGIGHDVQKYKQEFDLAHIHDAAHNPFVTFVTAFKGPKVGNQMEGVKAFYTLLKNLHMVDKRHFSWTSGYPTDHRNPDWEFSLGGDQVFFMPFLNKYSGSHARVSEIPMVIFNADSVFARLKQLKPGQQPEDAPFAKLKKQIHEREVRFHGGVHPQLGDKGQVSQLEQFALVEPNEMAEKEKANIMKGVLGECPFGKEDNV